MSLDLNQLIMLADKLGVVLLLLMILVGSHKEWWVAGPNHRRALKTWEKHCETIAQDRNYWRNGFLRTLGVNEKLADITKHTLPEPSED